MLTTIKHNPKLPIAYNFAHALLEFYKNDWQHEKPWCDAQGNIIAYGFLLKQALGAADYQVLHNFYNVRINNRNMKTWELLWLPKLGGMEHVEYVLTALIMLGIEDMHNDSVFMTPLHQAIVYNRIGNLMALIKCGVDVNRPIVESFGTAWAEQKRPFEHALNYFQDDQIVNALLKAGAKVLEQDIAVVANYPQLSKLKDAIAKVYAEQQKKAVGL